MSAPRAGGRVTLYMSSDLADHLRTLAEAHPGWSANALIREAIERFADELLRPRRNHGFR